MGDRGWVWPPQPVGHLGYVQGGPWSWARRPTKPAEPVWWESEAVPWRVGPPWLTGGSELPEPVLHLKGSWCGKGLRSKVQCPAAWSGIEWATKAKTVNVALLPMYKRRLTLIPLGVRDCSLGVGVGLGAFMLIRLVKPGSAGVEPREEAENMLLGRPFFFG